MAHDFPISLSTQLREHLRALRKQRHLALAQLGQRIGVSRTHIAEVEAKPGAVSVEQMLPLLPRQPSDGRYCLKIQNLTDFTRELKNGPKSSGRGISHCQNRFFTWIIN